MFALVSAHFDLKLHLIEIPKNCSFAAEKYTKKPLTEETHNFLCECSSEYLNKTSRLFVRRHREHRNNVFKHKNLI